MKEKISRREFLQATVLTGTVLLMKDFLPPAAGAQEVVRIPEADKIVITVITDNLADATRPDYKIAKRPTGTTSVLDTIMHAEHGLSYHVEIVMNGRPYSYLFDFATDVQGVRKNIDSLKLDFRKLDALALSHDHYDHQTAFIDLLKAKRDEVPKGLPFYVGEQFFVGTYARRPNGQIASLMALKREEVEGLGMVRIVETKTPTPIVPGAYLTGKVEQVTDYEKVASNFVAKRGDQFVQEEFPGEQAIVMNARGKGLVVLSGCSHRGIVNTVKHARKMTGMEKVHMIIGGCHLTGAKPELIQKTIADMKAIGPDYIAPTHCTGFEAIAAFAREMPESFILNTAGTKYIIG